MASDQTSPRLKTKSTRNVTIFYHCIHIKYYVNNVYLYKYILILICIYIYICESKRKHRYIPLFYGQGIWSRSMLKSQSLMVEVGKHGMVFGAHFGMVHYRKMHQNASFTLHFYDRFEDVQDVHISLKDNLREYHISRRNLRISYRMYDLTSATGIKNMLLAKLHMTHQPERHGKILWHG